VSYLTADHLGSPRINTDQNGEVTARHDYQPFGEEIQRASYGADAVRQQFTSYERDNEIDLDFAQNRYYSSPHGRFTSPDPLLSSGRVENAQTWNRYNYVLGNPLRYSDPLGLFEWDETAGGDATDEELQARSTDRNLRKKERKAARKALEFRNKFRASREQARQAASNPNLSEEQRTRILSAVDSYGEENDQNGVFVAVKPKLGTGTGASTLLRDDGTILVSFRENAKGVGLAIDIAHEGQHVYDADQFLSNPQANGDTDLTHYERERRAYEITSFVAQGLNQSSALKGFETKYQVWNKGWKNAEVSEKRAKGIDRLISNYYGYDATTNPGKKYSEEFNPQR
jgi:RHS repeat-associated protein